MQISSILLAISALLIITKSAIELPSSCINQPNGYQWLKLLESDEYPPINQKCDNQYMIIDLNRDKNVKHYFSSYDTWHYALSGASEMDGSNWEQWWLPNKQYLDIISSPNNIDANEYYFSYILSPDCNSCDISFNNENNPYSLSNDDKFGDRTSYYMTGTIFGCLYPHKALRDCIWDYNTYECNYCTIHESDGDLGYHTMNINSNNNLFFYKELYKQSPRWDILQIGVCGIYPQSTYTQSVPTTRDQCNSFQNNIKPSIGNNGRYCVCVKPPEQENIFDIMIKYPISVNIFNQYKHEFIQQPTHKDIGSIDDIIELYPSDFMEGTYRITKSGTYKIMSDIQFDFNAGDVNDPNKGDGWWPRMDQLDDYPGAYSLRDEYFMGFFAGISVECDDVIIDLNGFEIGQSLSFYYQQRFFSCISLKSVVFALNQGPGIFGTSPYYASNVIIKNGKIGLSSHHGIHGQNNNDITIQNVHIHSFETHGIELSAFNDLNIKNVEIGPSSNIAYLKGEYGYARWTLQRLERIQNEGNNNENDIFPIQFDGRDEELQFVDIINNLRNLMDIAFKSVMKIEQYDENNNDYIAAKQLFINSDGIPYGAVIYGLFLNLYFANVFAIHPSLKHSHNAVIEDLKIHDLNHKTVEYLRLDKYMTAPYKNPYNAALNAISVLGEEQINNNNDNMDWSKVTYIGDVLIDAYIVLDLITNNWAEKGMMLIGDEFIEWTFGDHQWDNNKKEGHPFIGCNGDTMTHVNKGIIGLRMDGVENIKFNTLDIYNLNEYSDLGSTLCTNYWDQDFKRFEGKGHFLQNIPYLYGYTGNMVHGIFSDWSIFSFQSNINIHDIYSKTGLVRGIGLYTNNKLTFIDNDDNDGDDTQINIFNIGAGIDLNKIDTKQLDHPYAPSIAKPFHIVNHYIYDNLHTFDTEINDKNINKNNKDIFIKMWCIFGHDGIDNDYDKFVIDNNNNECYLNSYKYKYINNTLINNNYLSAFIWSLIMILSVVLFIFIIYLFNKCYTYFNKSSSEYTISTSKHFSHYYGTY